MAARLVIYALILTGTIATIWLGGVVFLATFGYSAAQIEQDLCKGYRIQQQGRDEAFVTILKCSTTKVGETFPQWIAWSAVDPKERYTLRSMELLCRNGLKPRETNKRLVCAAYK